MVDDGDIPREATRLLDQMDDELSIASDRDAQTGPLFHYTSADGFLKILETRSIWATDFRYLNDREELILGERIIQAEAEKALEGFSKASGEAYILRNFCQIHPGATLSQVTNLYVTSLSEHGDQLSQWRAYGADGSGYAVGFRSLPLPKAAVPNAQAALTLFRCEYDEERFRATAREALLLVARGFVRYTETFARANAGFFHAFRRKAVSIALRRVATLVPRFKHRAFAEEGEWRLATFPLPEREYEIVQFRPGPRGVTPFVSTDLTHSESGLLDIHQVVVGPRHDSATAVRTAELLLRSRGYDPTGVVRSSEAPYRG